ncbi:hypothetical protein GW7_14854 [Heterocephalus glaber]|uniref:Ig-like domain-containing protein n=1 Tax=Heterocephalus glaber TaxID=10181 RepID=G5BCB5_HETGA|nr:hypothetical protein GW7_14854 [Heterocephalus glaber]
MDSRAIRCPACFLLICVISAELQEQNRKGSEKEGPQSSQPRCGATFRSARPQKAHLGPEPEAPADQEAPGHPSSAALSLPCAAALTQVLGKGRFQSAGDAVRWGCPRTCRRRLGRPPCVSEQAEVIHREGQAQQQAESTLDVEESRAGDAGIYTCRATTHVHVARSPHVSHTFLSSSSLPPAACTRSTSTPGQVPPPKLGLSHVLVPEKGAQKGLGAQAPEFIP